MDDKMFEWMEKTSTTLSRIEAISTNNAEHIISVSEKTTRVEKKIDDHLVSVNPHGEARAHRRFDDVFKVIMAVIGFGSLAWAVVRR